LLHGCLVILACAALPAYLRGPQPLRTTGSVVTEIALLGRLLNGSCQAALLTKNMITSLPFRCPLWQARVR
jgi:hypothetical protein